MNSWPGARRSAPQPLMGLNLGTGTAEEAAALVEYCNIDKGYQVERFASQARI